LQGAAGLAQSTALGGFLRQLALELGDLGNTGGDVVAEFEARAFQPAVGFARQLEILAQLFGLGFERRRLAFDLVEFGAQRFIGRARLLQHAGQAERLRFFPFQCAQRAIERRDDLVEGFLEFVELADLAAGVGQQVAQDLVFLAHARADVGKILDVDMVAVAIAALVAQAGRKLVGFAALPAKQIRQLSHDNASNPYATENAQQCTLRYYIPLAIGTHAVIRRVLQRCRPASWLMAKIMGETAAGPILSRGCHA
jgi:hypothetical protein